MLRTSSCWTEIASSQLLPRFRSGEIFSEPAGVPKLTLVVAPISLNWMLPAASITVPLPSRSVQVRVFDWPPSGLSDEVVPSALAARNLPTDTFNAVRPLPKRSYEPPARIDQSCQQGWQSAAGTLRSGTNGLAGAYSSGHPALNQS